MRPLPSRHRFSEWDGTQLAPVSADDALGAMVDDLMEYGDLRWAMRNLLSRGMPTEGGRRPGLREMLKNLRDQKRENLERFNLSSIFKDIEEKLEKILDMERETIDEWLARDEDDFSNQALRQVAQSNRERLDALPKDAAGRMKELEKYEFLNPQAQREYLELLNTLRKAMTQTFFNDIEKMVNKLSPGDMERMKDMLRDLNELLAKKAQGVDPDVLQSHFRDFMEKYGDMFGQQQPQSLDELLEQMGQQMAAAQALFNSLSPDQRAQLQSLLEDRFGDPALQEELQRLAEGLASFAPNAGRYRFTGDEDVDLDAAMRLMTEMQALDDLIAQVQTAERQGDLDKIDDELLRQLQGDDAADSLEDLKKLANALEEAGYIRQEGGRYALTPRGSRMIGQQALGEIYARLRRQNLGNHALPEEGRFGERQEESKPHEFGDPFHLHMPRTIRNAIDRDGPKTPVALRHEDFEIHRSERITSTATVMLVDLSWSMALRGSFLAAKKVALALHNLITSRYPKDSFHIIGFAAYAKELKTQDLPFLQWDEYVLGTNMQHALLLGERLLSRKASGTKQIIMISDGEPTAHLHNGRARFAYPPTAETYRATLRAVKTCTRKGIAINTFMLDADRYLKAFMDAIARINGGRVFYTSPEHLGEYILVDYVQRKRRRLAR